MAKSEADYREVTVEEPTTYFELADAEGSDLDGWRLGAYNGVTNSRYDLDAGAIVRIPKGTTPIAADPPAIDADEAGKRYEKTRIAAEATVAGAADALAGIDTKGAQGNEDAIALVVDGGQEPAGEAKADPLPDNVGKDATDAALQERKDLKGVKPFEPGDATTGADVGTLDGGTSTPVVSAPQDAVVAVPDNSDSPGAVAQVVRPSFPDNNTVLAPSEDLSGVQASDITTVEPVSTVPDPVADADQPQIGVEGNGQSEPK